MKALIDYVQRSGLKTLPDHNVMSLNNFLTSHLYNIPFENLSIRDITDLKSDKSKIFTRIVQDKRGGICFEFCLLLKEIFDYLKIPCESRLARLLVPSVSATTHQILILEVDGDRWVFDVGYGAKGPRGMLKLLDGFENNHPYLSSKITKDDKYGWIVSVKEENKHLSEWEQIYSFQDILTTDEDISMSYFYISSFPKSPFLSNSVISIPTINGRKSIKNKTYTKFDGKLNETFEIINDDKFREIINEEFKMNLLDKQ